jgi:DNA modification methylase
MKAKIILGDVRTSLQKIEEKSVQTCVTSPPYWGLRDYGNDGQIGIEQTPDEYVAQMVAVFREVWRVLRDDGTVWLNLGDSYASVHTGGHKSAKSSVGANHDGAQEIRQPKASPKSYGLKDKDLVGIPWRVALALQADGWYLRQDIIWSKPNPMPESVRDRCTKSHEYVFLLTKSPKYFYDNEAIKEPAQDWGTRDRTNGKYHNEGSGLTPHTGLTKSYETKNKRSVWSINTKPFKGAHFAVMPEALVEPCILAGVPQGGCCSVCRAPYIRDIEYGTRTNSEVRIDTLNVIPGRDKPSRLQSKAMETLPRKLLGWIQDCECLESEPIPSLALDPFTGSGTVAVVALRNNCNFIGTELNPAYAEIAKNRILDSNPMFNEVEII